MLKSTGKHGLILAAFALACSGVILAVHLQTKDRIQLEQDKAFARRLSEVLPTEAYNNNIAQDCIFVQNEELLAVAQPLKIYRASNNGEHAAVVFETVAPDGYSGSIKMLTGMYVNGEIAGVRVTEHKETPGLGDKIEVEKHPWITQFSGLSLVNPEQKNWTLKKDGGAFDGFAGATVTPRAVVNALRRVQVYYTEQRQEILDAANACKNGAGDTP